MSNPQRSLGEQPRSRAQDSARQSAVMPGRVTLFAWHQFALALIATIAILAAMAIPVIA